MKRKKNRQTKNFITSKTLMSKRFVWVSDNSNILTAAKAMKKNHVGAVLILKKKRVVGIVSKQDIITKVVAMGKDPKSIPLSKVMTRNVIKAKVGEALPAVLKKMKESGIRYIPVVDQTDNALGILCWDDLLANSNHQMKNMIRNQTKTLKTDALTGLRGYRYFNDYIDLEIARAQTTDTSFSLLFMDLDNFKELNDSQGHPMGNIVLKRFGEVLGTKREAQSRLFSLRQTDIAIRFGGDEFGLIFPATPASGAIIAASRLLEAVRAELNSIPGIETTTPITLSIGIAEFPKDAKSRDQLIQNADTALFEAKKRGKDRIQVFGETH
jgi:diguanylate cyclase (GGDEF)-like protein